MPSFVYTARDRSGLLQTGFLEAVDEDEVLAVLQNRGLIVTGLSRRESMAVQAAKRRMTRRLHGRVTMDDQILFCQQLATLLQAGVPLLKSLEVISAQVESQVLLTALEQMRQDIEAGRTFRDAIAKHPHVFSKFWVNLVETGEASGHLAQSLTQLARYLESSRNLQRKAMTALTYPAFLILAATVALMVFVVWIIPIFSRVFASMHAPLPWLTQLVIGLSDVMRHYFVLLILGAGCAVHFLRQFLKTDQGRWLLDRFLLQLPLFNRLIIHIQLAQFSRGLGALLESGVPILFGLEIMEHSATNTLYGRAIGQIREDVREGKTMAEPMERTGLFPPMTVQMVQVGEEIGELGKMLDRIAAYYEERVATFVERMGSLFEPIAIVVMALIVGTLVISMYLPIFSMAGKFQGGS